MVSQAELQDPSELKNYAEPDDLLRGLRAAIASEYNTATAEQWTLERAVTLAVRRRVVDEITQQCEAMRSLLSSVHYEPAKVSYYGPDGEAIMAQFLAFQVKYLGERVRRGVQDALNRLAHQVTAPPPKSPTGGPVDPSKVAWTASLNEPSSPWSSVDWSCVPSDDRTVLRFQVPSARKDGLTRLVDVDTSKPVAAAPGQVSFEVNAPKVPAHVVEAAARAAEETLRRYRSGGPQLFKSLDDV